MHKRTQTEDMTVFVGAQNAGPVSTYIVRNIIEIVSIERIGKCWLIKLANVDKKARLDIIDLIDCLEISTYNDLSDTVDPTNWGYF